MDAIRASRPTTILLTGDDVPDQQVRPFLEFACRTNDCHFACRQHVRGGPIRMRERVHAHRAEQSDAGRGYMPAERTNRMRGEGICPQGGTIG
eukprot:7978235-Pyramimonas_sp.AAC.1